MQARLDRTLKMGMVGGGPGAFIGDVHRRAALLDGGVELVAGAFSSSLRKSRSKGRELLLDPARVHGSLEALIAHELALPAGERVDDDASVLLRFDGGARGALLTSQVAVGEENGLSIRVYGERRGLRWRQETPDALQLTALDGPEETWSRGQAHVAARSPAAARATRLPSGHPEGFIEAFANVYANACDTIRARLLGEEPDPLALDYPTVEDGLRGMLFIEAVVRSARSAEKWTRLRRA